MSLWTSRPLPLRRTWKSSPSKGRSVALRGRDPPSHAVLEKVNWEFPSPREASEQADFSEAPIFKRYGPSPSMVRVPNREQKKAPEEGAELVQGET